MAEGAGGIPLHWFGVDKPDRRTVGHTTGKSCGRIDIETCTNDHQHIGLHAKFCRHFYVGNFFAKPYDVGAQRTSVGSLIAILHIGIIRRKSNDLRGGVGCLATGYFHQFAMQVEDISAAGTLMKVIHVLRDNLHIVETLQLSQQLMSKAWLCIKHLLAAQVVELGNKFRIPCPPLGRGNIFHFVLFPKTSAISEGTDTALGTHAGTGEDDDADPPPYQSARRTGKFSPHRARMDIESIL